MFDKRTKHGSSKPENPLISLIQKDLMKKLQWLKLYDHNPLYTTLVDKVKVRDYVERIEGYTCPSPWGMGASG